MSIAKSIAQELIDSESQATALLENWARVYNNSVADLSYPSKSLTAYQTAESGKVGVDINDAKKAEVALLMMRERHYRSQELLRIKFQKRLGYASLAKRLKLGRTSTIKYTLISLSVFFDHFVHVTKEQIEYIDELEKKREPFDKWAEGLDW